MKENLLEEKEKKGRMYGRKRYKNLPKDKKLRLVEYKKNYFKRWKKRLPMIRRTYNLFLLLMTTA